MDPQQPAVAPSPLSSTSSPVALSPSYDAIVTRATTPSRRWRSPSRPSSLSPVTPSPSSSTTARCMRIGDGNDAITTRVTTPLRLRLCHMYAAPSPSWSRSSPIAPSPSTYNRIWAEVGMVVGDDVAIDAINEFLSILYSQNHVKSNLHEKLNMFLAHQNFCIKSILHGNDFM